MTDESTASLLVATMILLSFAMPIVIFGGFSLLQRAARL